MSKVKTQVGHEHTFVFLRQERLPLEQWGERVSKWKYVDVFFCDGCLAYQQVLVKETVPSRTDFGKEDITWSSI